MDFRRLKRELLSAGLGLAALFVIIQLAPWFIWWFSNSLARNHLNAERELPPPPLFPGIAGIVEYLPLIVAVVGVAALLGLLGRIWWRNRTHHRLVGRLAHADRMNDLSWQEFEQAIAGFFEARGYSVSLTPPSGDDGVDIELRKGGTRGIVQCKHWPERCVSVAEVRELLGAKHDFGVDEAYMVTSGSITRSARALVRRNEGLHAWDGAQIRGMVNRMLAADMAREALNGEAAAEPEPVAVPQERVCPSCGHKLVIRDGRHGRFIGCTAFPECRYTRDLGAEDREAI